jgi:hypothetical protein
MTATMPAPAAVAADAGPPCPRVEVTLTAAVDTATATLTRHSAAGATPVRGGHRVSVSGAAIINDYEAPLGVPVTYTAVAYNSAGQPAVPSPPSAPVTLADPECPWLHAALRPATALQVTPTSWATRAHTREASILWPATGTAAIAVVNVRPRPTTPLGLLTRTVAEADELLAVLNDPNLLFRPPSTWGWPGGISYAADVAEARYAPTRPVDERRLWTMTLVPVLDPPASLVEPVTTWGQVVSFYPTWSDVLAVKATWLRLIASADPGTP